MVIHALLAATLAMTSLHAQAPAVDCARVKCLALTFDDGPGPYTPTMLKILRKAGAKATFFLVGKRVEERPEVARRTLAQGHAIGNHTWSHASLPALLDDEILDELKVTQSAIRKATGLRPVMFRPPYGQTNDRVLGLADQVDLAQVLWTGTTLDWKLRDEKKIRAAVLRLAKRDGVILMHDVVPATVNAMPGILKELKKRGYHLVTVPTLLRGKGPKSGVTYP
ncbi:polysaccharide deacetylase family protein [Nonomuraea phyllanthi]|uniref:Polysaccharide deacetylase family protein n=1 Tax=Nonomuraea phyllanthi TaxID=2219224 RepID=A0A5C4WWM7_9ACTN|nr:polysaccharide deacetylase family protein [Nonomuraea phyllanthi]KAB8197857.1 polysaccharide deacetylase family protein [Nonomuraea phyllanthi]QFY06166.1 polysaccharide deacetylase family protein [Nonomuraea phyllanthi]